jgi:hypothetical protein
VTRNDYRQYWDRATPGARDLEKPHGGGTRHLGHVWQLASTVASFVAGQLR